VTMFTAALIHGAFSIFQFHALGNINPLVSVFVSNRHYYSLLNFPFQSLGFFALVILLLMAATSHDFWLNNLSPKVWKSLHMMVYVAYALLVFHVMLGVIQLEQSPYLTGLLFSGATIIALLHLAAGLKERRLDQKNLVNTNNEFVFVCRVEEIIEKRARVFRIGKERVAVFKYDGKISAMSNVCKHQNGPLGEGKIIDGCITCPWHGYQYLPHNGRAPEPFQEKVTTYRVKIMENKVYVDHQALAEGTEVTPAQINY
jgi:nitrite reductase/ring-hydroxylating ferredoxin subunit